MVQSLPTTLPVHPGEALENDSSNFTRPTGNVRRQNSGKNNRHRTDELMETVEAMSNMPPEIRPVTSDMFRAPSRANRAIAVARERFISNGCPPKAPIRAEIAAAWQRSFLRGLRPTTDRAPCIDSPERWCRAQASSEFGSAAIETLDSFKSMLEGSECVLVAAECRGTIFHVVGDKLTRRSLEDINFMCGGTWSEDIVGPNGIGTPLRLGSSEFVFGNEHYCVGWQPWASFGSPVRSPESGRILGVVDLTCPTEEARQEHLVTITAVAQSIEQTLRSRELKRRESLFPVFHERARHAGADGIILLSRGGKIVLANDLAKRLLGGGSFEGQPLLATLPEPLQRALRGLRIDTHVPVEHALNYGPVQGLLLQPLRDATANLAGYLLVLRGVDTAASEPPTIRPSVSMREECDSNPLRATTNEIILRTVAECNGEVGRAARRLGIARSTVYRRLKKSITSTSVNAATNGVKSSEVGG